MFNPTAITPQTERARIAQMLIWLKAAQGSNPVPGVSQEALRRLLDYVRSWSECAPNAMLWRDRFPAQWQAICRSLAKTQLMIYPAVDGCLAAWDMRPGVSAARDADLWRADKLFADFLVGFHDKIGACRRDGCGKYFERNRRKSTYCSDRCGKIATSRVAKSAARHNERHGRMLRVLAFLRKLRKSVPRVDLVSDPSVWKDQATRNVKGVTDRWLNEAILGRLKTPDGFANCDRCREIQGQIHEVLKG